MITTIENKKKCWTCRNAGHTKKYCPYRTHSASEKTSEQSSLILDFDLIGYDGDLDSSQIEQSNTCIIQPFAKGSLLKSTSESTSDDSQLEAGSQGSVVGDCSSEKSDEDGDSTPSTGDSSDSTIIGGDGNSGGGEGGDGSGAGVPVGPYGSLFSLMNGQLNLHQTYCPKGKIASELMSQGWLITHVPNKTGLSNHPLSTAVREIAMKHCIKIALKYEGIIDLWGGKNLTSLWKDIFHKVPPNLVWYRPLVTARDVSEWSHILEHRPSCTEKKPGYIGLIVDVYQISLDEIVECFDRYDIKRILVVAQRYDFSAKFGEIHGEGVYEIKGNLLNFQPSMMDAPWGWHTTPYQWVGSKKVGSRALCSTVLRSYGDVDVYSLTLTALPITISSENLKTDGRFISKQYVTHWTNYFPWAKGVAEWKHLKKPFRATKRYIFTPCFKHVGDHFSKTRQANQFNILLSKVSAEIFDNRSSLLAMLPNKYVSRLAQDTTLFLFYDNVYKDSQELFDTWSIYKPNIDFLRQNRKEFMLTSSGYDFVSYARCVGKILLTIAALGVVSLVLKVLYQKQKIFFSSLSHSFDSLRLPPLPSFPSLPSFNIFGGIKGVFSNLFQQIQSSVIQTYSALKDSICNIQLPTISFPSFIETVEVAPTEPADIIAEILPEVLPSIEPVIVSPPAFDDAAFLLRNSDAPFGQGIPFASVLSEFLVSKLSLRMKQACFAFATIVLSPYIEERAKRFFGWPSALILGAFEMRNRPLGLYTFLHPLVHLVFYFSPYPILTHALYNLIVFCINSKRMAVAHPEVMDVYTYKDLYEEKRLDEVDLILVKNNSYLIPLNKLVDRTHSLDLDKQLLFVDLYAQDEKPNPGIWPIFYHNAMMYRPQGAQLFAAAFQLRNLCPCLTDSCVDENSPCDGSTNENTICDLAQKWVRVRILYEKMIKRHVATLDYTKKSNSSWLKEINGSLKKQRLRRALDEFEETPVCRLTAKWHMKSDEVLVLKPFADGKFLKPRVIKDIDTSVQVIAHKHVDMAFNNFKRVFNPKHVHQIKNKDGKKIKITLTVGSGKTSTQLSKWFNKSLAQLRAHEIDIAVIVAGDDMMGLMWKDGKIVAWESDYSKYDRTQGRHAKRVELDIQIHMGVPETVADILYKCSEIPARFHFRKDALSYKLENHFQTGTGSADTTSSNSVGAPSPVFLTLYSFGLDEFSEHFEASCSALGFEAKFSIHENLSDATFLKGQFFPSDDNYSWLPLVSQYIKLTKVLTDPRQVFSKEIKHQYPKMDQEQTTRIAYQKMLYCFYQNYKNIPCDYPILGPLINRYKQLMVETRVEMLDDRSHKVSLDQPVTIDRTQALEIIQNRYDITYAQILWLEAVTSTLEIGDLLFDPVLLKLRDKDYA